MIVEKYRFQARGGTAANLAEVNEVPLVREVIVERDTQLIKIGDGVTAYNDLPYIGIVSTDNVPEGDENLYFTATRAASVAPVQSVNGLTGSILLSANDVGAIADAPSDGSTYGRKDGLWVGVSSGGGTITSVGLSAPTGLEVSGSPLTSSGTLTLSWSAGYQGYTSTEADKLAGIAPGAQVNAPTNLAQGTRTETTVTVTSSTGGSATLAAATTSLAGVMASAEKTKLDGVASGATVGAAWGTNLSGIPTNITGWAGITPASKWDTSNATAANLGTNSPSVESDLNSPLGGPYKVIRAAGSTANRPALVSGAGFYLPVDANSGAEFFFRAHPTSADVWTRPASAGAFGPWAKIFVDNQSLIPAADATYSVGSGALRMLTIFAQTGTINTSDAREKTTPRDLTPTEIACGLDIARLPCIYQWLASIAEKGEEAARLHCGPTVQAVIAVMEAHGLDPFRYSFVCYDAWPELPEIVQPWNEERDDDGNVTREAGSEVVQEYRPAGDRYSLRPSGLDAFCRRALVADRDALEARISALEG